MVTVRQKGNFEVTQYFLKNAQNIEGDIKKSLKKYAEKGVAALASATPKDTGRTADSWGYKIYEDKKQIVIAWTNSNIVDGVPIAVILQYGHGTGTGGYVQGRDYINPAIRPIFDNIVEDAWKEVTR